LADSALLSLRWIDAWLGTGSLPGAERQARRESLERSLAADAYLGGRAETPGTRDRDEVIRGLLLLAHLQLAGYEATQHRLEASSKLALSNNGREILSGLGMQADVGARLGFSCDTVQRVSAAGQVLGLKQSPSPDEMRQMLKDLTAAIVAEPRPARHQPGCGLTQLANYNPYLPLAQLMSMQQGGAQRAEDSTRIPLRVAGVVLVPIETAEGAPE
jgi:hypothetical protein